MTDTTQEPTMEEILASIRRIISEDEPASSTPEASAAAPHGDKEADVLELTHKVEPTAGGDLAGTSEHAFEDETEKAETTPETVGDLDVFEAAPTPANQIASPPPQAEPAPKPAAPQSGSPMAHQPLVSDHAAQAAASRFDALEQSVKLDQGVVMASSQTLDQVIRDMVNPILKAWLDENLERIVDAKVQAEVERISRRR